MAMSDCAICWETPCQCGWEYKDNSAENLSKHIAKITQFRTKEQAKAIIERALNIVDELPDWQDPK